MQVSERWLSAAGVVLSPAELPGWAPLKHMMKRIYLPTLAAILAAGSVQAQRAGNEGLQLPNKLQRLELVKTPNVRPATAPVAERADAIFLEDFANGLNGNSGFGAWTTDGPNGDIWRKTTTGPTGPYSSTSERLDPLLTSSNNGFMIFASDSANTNWNTTPPSIVENPVNWVGSLVSPVLDLTENPEVEIRFAHRFRYCCAPLQSGSSHLLEVSLDGGDTWPSNYRFPLEDGTAGNTDSETRLMARKLNGILVGNDASQVRFRFTHDGTPGVSHYHWQVDDVGIFPIPEHELIMNFGFLAQFGDGYEYHRVPQAQLLDQVQAGAQVWNYGLEAQTNVSVNISLEDEDGNEVASLSQNLGTLAENDTVMLDQLLAIPFPMEPGLYTCHFTMSSDDIDLDDNPNNNSGVRYMMVTENAYGLDGINIIPTDDLVLASGGTDSWPGDVTDVRLLNLAIINEPQVFTGVEIYLSSNNTQAGSYFIGALYPLTAGGDNINTDTPIAASDVRIITASDINSRVVYAEFLDPIELGPGEFGQYYVSANLYQEAGKDIRILDDLTVPQPGDASLLWLPSDNTLYSNGNSWAIRLVKRSGVGIQENPSLEGVTIYPSPTDGPLQIEVDAPGRMEVEVFNALGELVHTSSFQGSRTTLDLSDQAAGMYTVRVSNGDLFNIQRVVLR